MTREEAEACLRGIRANYARWREYKALVRRGVYEICRRRGYRALGYETEAQFAEEALGIRRRYLIAMKSATETECKMCSFLHTSGQSEEARALEADWLSESQLGILTAIPGVENRIQAYREAKKVASAKRPKPPTASQIRQTANDLKLLPTSSAADKPGNGMGAEKPDEPPTAPERLVRLSIVLENETYRPFQQIAGKAGQFPDVAVRALVERIVAIGDLTQALQMLDSILNKEEPVNAQDAPVEDDSGSFSDSQCSAPPEEADPEQDPPPDVARSMPSVLTVDRGETLIELATNCSWRVRENYGSHIELEDVDRKRDVLFPARNINALRFRRASSREGNTYT
jgi:hypothetical protein